MSWTVFLAALASALLHACWNVVAKKQAVPSDALLGIIIATASLCALALPFVGLPPPETWPWIGSAALCNVIYSRALMEAYDRADFGVAYPAVRAVIPPVLFVLGWALLDEPPRASALLGLAIVAAGFLLFAAPSRPISRTAFTGLLCAIFAGSVLAVSFALDTKGVRLTGGGFLDFIQYGVASSLVTAATLTAVALCERRDPLRILRQHGRACYAGAALLGVSYFLALWAYAQGPVGLVAIVREANILFGVLLAVVLLHERFGRLQWGAVGLATVGAALLRFG